MHLLLALRGSEKAESRFTAEWNKKVVIGGHVIAVSEWLNEQGVALRPDTKVYEGNSEDVGKKAREENSGKIAFKAYRRVRVKFEKMQGDNDALASFVGIVFNDELVHMGWAIGI